jgi:hypothetical protein
MFKIKIIDKIEMKHILISSLIIGFLFSFNIFTISNWFKNSLLGAMAIIVNVLGHKLIANKKGCTSNYRIWNIKRFGFRKENKLPKKIFGKKVNSIYAGIILPLTLSFLSLGGIKALIVGTNDIKETVYKRIKKKYEKLTEVELATIAAIGTLTSLFVALIFQILNLRGFEQFVTMNYLIAIYSLVPLENLDGIKMLFGSIPIYLFTLVLILSALILINITSLFLTIILAGIIATVIALTYFYRLN